MATRRERFLKTRRRHLARYRKMRARGWNWVESVPGDPAFPHWKRAGRQWVLPAKGLQAPLDLSDAGKVFGPLLPGFPPAITPGTLPAKYKLPPVPFLAGFVMDAWRASNRHATGAFHGYHQRRVHMWGRKIGRMTGRTRRIWGNNIFFMQNGYFRDSDPLARHPSETDVNNGAPIVADPVWPGFGD